MRRFWLYLAAAIVVGAFFLWLAARELPWGEFEAWVAQADAGHILLWCGVYVVIYGLCHLARIVRWNALVQPLGEDIPAMQVHRACAVGFTAILLLPFRLGEFVRPILLSRNTSLTVSGVLGTVVVERVVDGLIMTGLVFVTLATYDGIDSAAFAHTAATISAAIFVPALLVCVSAMKWREPTISLLRRIGTPISAKLTERVLGMLEAFIDGFAALAAGRSMLRFLMTTAVYWIANIVSMWLLLHYGFGFESIGLWASATIMGVMVLGLMLPAGPGMTGNFEFFALKSVALFVALEGTAAVQAAAFAAVLHILQFVVIVGPGLVVMWSDPQARHLIRLTEEG